MFDKQTPQNRLAGKSKAMLEFPPPLFFPFFLLFPFLDTHSNGQGTVTYGWRAGSGLFFFFFRLMD
jgi:hypothetical protein